MQVKVDINKVEIMQTEQVNSGEYNTRELQFNIAENMRGLILKALFTKDYKTYEVDIESDSCMIPWEVLKTDGNCELGVYAYNVNGEVLEIRYSPEPTKFYINAGSYKTEVENGEQPTPTRTEVLEGKIEELDNKKVDKKEGYGLSQNDFTNELKTTLENLENYDDTEIKESVENIKNDLTNYYKKSETYNKEEIDNKISKIPKLEIEVVDSLPTENISEEKLYLVKSGAESENLYTEYIYVNGKWEKLGEQKLNISHLATKIELEEVKTELNAEIERLTAENEQQAEQINYLDKTLPRAEASGENINIKNSAEYPISIISIDTNIKQDSREGYNELDTSNYVFVQGDSTDLNCKRQDDGSFIINGTTGTTGADIRIVSDTPLITLKAGTHTFYFGDIETYNMFNCEANLSIFGLGTYTLIKRIAEGINYKTITLTEDLEIYNIGYHLNVSKTYNNFVLKPMIYEGAYDVNKVFEQYGAMPSIEFPSEIKTPVGKQSVVAGNKNKLKKFNETNSYSNVAIEITNGYRFKVNGTPNLTWVNLFSAKELKISKGETITFSTKNMKHSLYARINYSDGTYNNYVEIGKTSKTLTLSKDMVSYYLYISGLTVGTAIDYEFEAQLEYGDTATEIVEPQSQVQDIDVGELLGTIVDKEDGSYFEGNFRRLTDISNLTKSVTVEQGSLIKIEDINTNRAGFEMKSTHQKNTGKNSYNSEWKSYDGNKFALLYPSSTKYVYFNKQFNKEVEFINWWNENGIELVYPLATPTYTKLTDEQQAQWNKIKKMHTYEGVTNIYTINDNGISPVINMKYVKSPKVVEENLQAQIDKLKNSIISMGGNV